MDVVSYMFYIENWQCTWMKREEYYVILDEELSDLCVEWLW